MAKCGLSKVPKAPSIPHGYLQVPVGKVGRAHTPTGPGPINTVSPWFTENSHGIPVPHPLLTMGAVAVYLTLKG